MKKSIDTYLGKKVTYDKNYDSNLLIGIPRELGREGINPSNLSLFKGFDIWNCYELSWLNNKGKPCVKILQFIVPFDSKYLIESKSLKLYLNSFNNSKFTNQEEVETIIQKDLSNTTQSKVDVTIKNLTSIDKKPLTQFEGINIDDLDVDISDYTVDSNLLKLENTDNIVEETLCSDLLKSNCLVTNQPDWASVQIKYKGKKIDHKSLLQYIISFRNHNEFHEQCVEHMFSDIMEKCSPLKLTIHAKYTRRGGIDINPYRSNVDIDITKINIERDIRQ